jgi:long-chain acyl-CoA synthetase
MGDRLAISSPAQDRELTWRIYEELVGRVAAGLRALGLKRGDTLAVMLTNRWEFHVVDAAAMHLGVVTCSIYNTAAAGQIEHILGDLAPSLIVSERSLLARVEAADTGSIPVLVLDGPRPGDLSWEDVASPGRAEDLVALREAIEPGDLLCVVYTSGTSGPAKGVEFTHEAAVCFARALLSGLGTEVFESTISYLPMAHVAERVSSHYGPMVVGGEIVCCPDPLEVVGYLVSRPPTWFFSVPRVWEKLKLGLEAAVASYPEEERSPAERALERGLERVRGQLLGSGGERGMVLDGDPDARAGGIGEGLDIDAGGASESDANERAEWAIDERVYTKLRKMVGLDAAECVLVGAAPSSLATLEFFHAIGVPLLEVWGMSELCAVCTLNPREQPRLGTVGRALPGVELRTARDGELEVRTRARMRGYRNQPELTTRTVDPDGWLRTGDLASIDGEGYVRIIGRKKEIIVTAGGKNVAPQNIEAALRSSSPLLAHACCVGDGRPFIAALLALEEGVVAAPRAGDPESGTRLSAELMESLCEAVREANRRFSRAEQVKRFVVLADVWEPGGEVLTSTMKVKRAAIQTRYARLIEALYAPTGGSVEVDGEVYEVGEP